MKRKILFSATIAMALILTLLVIKCPFCRYNKGQVMNGGKVSFAAPDGVKIVSLYYPAEGERGIILAHQLGRDKNSWGDWPEFLQKNGFSVLAIDLRGHGESDLKYQNFSDRDFNNMTLDIETAQTYLKQQSKTEISLMGSSIGANLSLIEKGKALSAGGFAKTIALSPGLNFKGLDAEKGAKNIALQKLSKKEVLLIASAGDSYSYKSAQLLEKILDGESELLIYQTGGHGMALLAAKPELKTKIINFLQDK